MGSSGLANILFHWLLRMVSRPAHTDEGLVEMMTVTEKVSGQTVNDMKVDIADTTPEGIVACQLVQAVTRWNSSCRTCMPIALRQVISLRTRRNRLWRWRGYSCGYDPNLLPNFPVLQHPKTSVFPQTSWAAKRMRFACPLPFSYWRR